MPEVRVTIDDKMDALLDEIMVSGLYPSKAEFVRCAIVQRRKELGFLPHLKNLQKT